jgi:hypothetical protein
LQSTNAIESMISILRRTSSAGRAATCACAGRPPGCSKPNSSSARSSATPTSPTRPRRRARRRRKPIVDDHACDRRAGRYARHRLTISSGSSPRSSTAQRDMVSRSRWRVRGRSA